MFFIFQDKDEMGNLYGWITLCAFSLFLYILVSINGAASVQILSKSKLEKCERSSDSDNNSLNCTRKIVINMAVPSGSVSPYSFTFLLFPFCLCLYGLFVCCDSD